MNKKFVYIVGGDALIAAMFMKKGWGLTNDVLVADLVQFTGGEDVTPSLYKQEALPCTHYNAARDAYETSIYEDCIKNNIPMAGICRGGQFLNVMNGGSMWQDVDGHAIWGTHSAWTTTDEEVRIIEVTSTHHQMMNPTDKAILLLAAEESTFKLDANGKVLNAIDYQYDVEAVFYPDTQSLCFQPHPEYNTSPKECTDLYFEYIDLYLDKCNCP